MKFTLDFSLLYFVALLNLSISANYVNFDITAQFAHSVQKKCLTYWMSKGSHVTAHFRSSQGQSQKVNFEIYDNSAHGNQYGTKNDFNEQTLVFTPQENTDVFFCFWNVLDEGLTPGPTHFRQVGIQIQIGKTDEDYQKLAKAEKLKPHEVTLKQLQERFYQIIDIMDMFKNRDLNKLATHESAKHRIASFSFISIGVLLVVGVWQIIYLRSFFKSKRLI